MVHFVGAGSGAVDLITVRGKNLLEQADVIIYAGSLVNPQLLDNAKKECEIHNSAYMTLEEVIEVMKDAWERNLDVVRLHTGEPSIYGAVREQMDMLDKLEIEYDSTPGVMAGRTAVPEKESIESFAAHRASMAIYLSTGMLEELSKRLINGGYDRDTPAALVYKATWDDEKKFVGTISTLADIAKKNNITKTAIVLVGDAIAHNDYEKSRLYAADFDTEFRKRI